MRKIKQLEIKPHVKSKCTRSSFIKPKQNTFLLGTNLHFLLAKEKASINILIGHSVDKRIQATYHSHLRNKTLKGYKPVLISSTVNVKTQNKS